MSILSYAPTGEATAPRPAPVGEVKRVTEQDLPAYRAFYIGQ